MFQFILIFTIASLVNVVLSTIKTIVMYKHEALSSALANAITYGFYTYIVVLMAGDMPLGIKMLVTAVTNFIGVWVSVKLMARLHKDELWQVTATAHANDAAGVEQFLLNANIPFNTIECADGNHIIVNMYCATSQQSLAVKEILKQFNLKYTATASKTL